VEDIAVMNLVDDIEEKECSVRELWPENIYARR
jgi:hypothetical protein